MIRTYYQQLRDENWLKPDRHLTVQRVVYNDPVARHVQHQLVPLVSSIVGADMKPSFSYAVEYQGGAELPRHIDREQCEYTMSLFVEYLPAPADDICPWPLTIHHPEGDVVLHQARGGGVLFRGRKLPHSRAPLESGASAMLFFLCYVDEGFEGSLS